MGCQKCKISGVSKTNKVARGSQQNHMFHPPQHMLMRWHDFHSYLFYFRLKEGQFFSTVNLGGTIILIGCEMA